MKKWYNFSIVSVRGLITAAKRLPLPPLETGHDTKYDIHTGKMNMGCIYLIRNTVNGKCYIGQSVDDTAKGRIRRHLSGGNSPYFKNAVKKYGRDAFETEILYDNILPEFLSMFEIEAIKEYDCIAPNGYNLTSGGERGYTRSEVVLKKMSESQKGKKASKEARINMSKAQKGRKHTEETKKRMSLAQKGKKKKNPPWNKGKRHSKETLQKISDKLKGMEVWNKGVPHTKEARQKMSDKLKGRKVSQETRDKISRANKGRTFSAEHRRKLSESNKAARKRMARQL